MGNRPFSRKNCNFFCKLTAFWGWDELPQSKPDGNLPLPSSPTAMPPSPRGRLWAVAAKFPAQRKGVPLGKVAATSGSRRKGYSLPAASSPSPSLLTQCHLSQRERLWRNRTLCSSTGNYTAMPRALPLGELSPKVTERARMLPAERIPNRPRIAFFPAE